MQEELDIPGVKRQGAFLQELMSTVKLASIRRKGEGHKERERERKPVAMGDLARHHAGPRHWLQ